MFVRTRSDRARSLIDRSIIRVFECVCGARNMSDTFLAFESAAYARIAVRRHAFCPKNRWCGKCARTHTLCVLTKQFGCGISKHVYLYLSHSTSAAVKANRMGKGFLCVWSPVSQAQTRIRRPRSAIDAIQSLDVILSTNRHHHSACITHIFSYSISLCSRLNSCVRTPLALTRSLRRLIPPAAVVAAVLPVRAPMCSLVRARDDPIR